MSDSFVNLSDALAGFGIALVERTRLTFGAPTLKALSEVPASTGKVFVACKGGDTLLSLPSKVNDEARKSLRVIDATDTEYSKVRPHVANFAKSRKVNVTVATLKNGEGDPVGFTITKRK